MLYSCYLRQGTVYIPTVGRRGGAYTEIEPVSVLPISNTEGLRQEFLNVIARKNTDLPIQKNKGTPPILPKYAGVKSWSAFASGALTWNIQEKGGDYRIVGYHLGAEGYWTEDPEQKIEFPPGTTVGHVIDRMIAILQEAARH